MIEDRRYFINDTLKTKFSSDKVYGNPECLICRTKLILDIHHLYKYKKMKLDNDQIQFFKLKKLDRLKKVGVDNNGAFSCT